MNAPNTPKPIATRRFGYPFKNKQEKEITDPQAFYAGLVDAYAQNQKERERPAPPPAPTLTLYSLYMHVADFESYGKHPKWSRAAWWPVKHYRVGKKAKDRIAGTRERSGRQWVERFPTSRAIGDLTPGFAASVNQFVQALQSAGASVRVSATYRPTERAYLMHYAWRIAREGRRAAQLGQYLLEAWR